MPRIVVIGLLFGLLCGCTTLTPRTGAAISASSPEGTPTPLPTPTTLPTAVPGTNADIRDATAVVQQFTEAVVRNDEIVALLVLSPSARKVVAASDLAVFLGRAEQPTQVTVRAVHLDSDVATADCVFHYEAGEQVVQLRLVRLDGQWRVDGPVSE